MADYNKLRDICEEFIDNIDGWCELDDGDMIDKSLVEMKAALKSLNSNGGDRCLCGNEAQYILCDDCLCDKIFEANRDNKKHTRCLCEWEHHSPRLEGKCSFMKKENPNCPIHHDV